MTDLWDDVPDLTDEQTRYLIRSKPPYPDVDPEGTARMYAALIASREVEVEDDSEFDITITQESEEFDDPISALAGWVKLAHSNGWVLHRLAHSRAFAKGKPFKTGANEGASRPDQDIEQQWLFAEKPGTGRIIVSYEIVNDTPRGTGTVRRFNGRRYGDRELKAIVKGTT